MKALFIDDHVVEEIDNLARKLHQPQKFEGNVVLRPEYRWENHATCRTGGQDGTHPLLAAQGGAVCLLVHPVNDATKSPHLPKVALPRNLQSSL